MVPLPRFALAYLAYFAYLGAFGPFWAHYMRRTLGFDDGFVGWMAAVLVLCLIAGSFVLSRLADRYRCRRRLQRGVSALAAVACAGWLFVRTEAEAMALVAVVGVFAHTQVPMLDAAAIDALGAERHRFGRIRLAGTIGWGLASLLLGGLRTTHPRSVLVVAVVALGVFHLATWMLPDTQVRIPTGPVRKGNALRRLFAHGGYAVLVGVTFLHATAFAPYETFGALFFEEAGLTAPEVSAVHLTGIACEVLVFLAVPRLLRRVPAAMLILAGTSLAALRWRWMPEVSSAFGFMALQTLHGVNFGLWYAATLHLLGRFVPPELRTTGQAGFAMAYSSGIGVGGRLTGWSRGVVGPDATLGRAALVSLAASALVLLFRHRLNAPEPPRESVPTSAASPGPPSRDLATGEVPEAAVQGASEPL